MTTDIVNIGKTGGQLFCTEVLDNSPPNDLFAFWCLQVVMQYLKDYPLGKKIKKHFEFYAQQLSYELEDGRMSALKVLRSIFSSFDEVGPFAAVCGCVRACVRACVCVRACMHVCMSVENSGV